MQLPKLVVASKVLQHASLHAAVDVAAHDLEDRDAVPVAPEREVGNAGVVEDVEPGREYLVENF